MNFLWYILIGAAAGCIAGKLSRGEGYGCLLNIIVGIVGGVLGGWVFGLFGLSTSSIVGNLIMSVVGALIFLWILALITGRK